MHSHSRAAILAVLAALCSAPAWAQPVVESVSNTGSLSGGSSDIVITAPTGAGADDLLVACLSGTVSGDTSDANAAGWTHVATTGGTSGDKTAMLWKEWDSGDGATYTLTLTSGSATARRGLILRISGANVTTPSDATPSESGPTSSSARTYATITTVTNDALAVGCLRWGTNDVTYTPEGTLTNRVLQQRQAADTKVITSAGATGALTGSGANTTWSSIWWAIAPELTPAGSGKTRCTTIGVCDAW